MLMPCWHLSAIFYGWFIVFISLNLFMLMPYLSTCCRYFYHGTEEVTACKVRCAEFGRGTKCKCMDYGKIRNYQDFTCHLQDETAKLTQSGEGLTAYIPC